MAKKEAYETPRAEVVRFEDSDVIITSTGTSTTTASGSGVTASFY